MSAGVRPEGMKADIPDSVKIENIDEVVDQHLRHTAYLITEFCNRFLFLGGDIIISF